MKLKDVFLNLFDTLIVGKVTKFKIDGTNCIFCSPRLHNTSYRISIVNYYVADVNFNIKNIPNASRVNYLTEKRKVRD